MFMQMNLNFVSNRKSIAIQFLKCADEIVQIKS